MDEKTRATFQYQMRLERLMHLGTKAPVILVVAECALVLDAASRMGVVPVDHLGKLQQVLLKIAEARSTPEFKKLQAQREKDMAAMELAVHLPTCPAYKLWVKNSMPAAPGQCNCGTEG